jgi:hypothetical protein
MRAKWPAIARVTRAETRVGSSASGSRHSILQALADAGLGEVGEFDAMRARVGEGGVGGAGACEVGVQFDDVADIDDDQERRPALVGGQRASVAFGLAARALQSVVETLAGSAEADLLGFENEMAALVAVDAPARRAAVAVAKADAALEDVGVVAVSSCAGSGEGTSSSRQRSVTKSW